MPLIPIVQARNLITQSSVGLWKETFAPTNLFLSYFGEKYSPSELVSIEVQRGIANIAVDVMRGSEANGNNFGKSTMKVMAAPLFFEKFTNTDLDLYNQLFGYNGEVIDSEIVKALATEIAEKYQTLHNKIDLAYEVNAAQVLQTGKLTTRTLDEIDFKAKNTHITTLSTKWATTANSSIFTSITDLCRQLKKDGAAAVEFDLIMGASAASTLLNSADYKSNYALNPITVADVAKPKAMMTGATFIRTIVVDTFIVNLYSYESYYTNSSGSQVTILDPKKVVLIAKSFKGVQSYAAVPRVLPSPNGSNVQVMSQGRYVRNNYTDPATTSHTFDVKSAALPVPVTIDHFGCMTVLA